LSAAGEASRRRLRGWLLLVPDPCKRAGGRPLEFVLALAVCAFTAAGRDSPTAIAEWARDRAPQTLLALGGRPHPLADRVRAPSARTFRRVFAKIDAHSFNQALYGFLEVTRIVAGEPARGCAARAGVVPRRRGSARAEHRSLLPQAADGKSSRS
jgi:hypothetical protein